MYNFNWECQYILIVQLKRTTQNMSNNLSIMPKNSIRSYRSTGYNTSGLNQSRLEWHSLLMKCSVSLALILINIEMYSLSDNYGHIKWHRFQRCHQWVSFAFEWIGREKKSTLSGWCLVSAFYCVLDNKAGCYLINYSATICARALCTNTLTKKR